MKRKKIVIVRDSLSRANGGAITALLSLAANIKDEYDLKFVFLYEDTVDKVALAGYEYECILPTFNIPRIERKVRLYTSTKWKLNVILKKEAPDCVISFGSTSLTLVTMLKSRRGYRTIYSERSDPNYCARTISDKLRYYCYNFADKMVFQVPGVRDYFNEKIRKKSVIIPNPVGIPTEQWRLEGTKDIVCVARMEMRQKRHDVLFKAFKKVLERVPEVRLHLYGDGGDMQKTRNLAGVMGLEDKVVFHGNIKNVKDAIGKYRVSVLTSDYEGMPNTLLEAMAKGMPVVATDCSPGGAAYLIENNINGILVPRGDSDAVAEAIVKILKDDSFAIKIGNAARERAKQQSYERNKEEWLKTISEVLK